MKKNTFIEEERDSRQGTYAIPELHQKTLQTLNARMEGCDDDILDLLSDQAVHPSILVLGLPRSWTTLCLQLLTTCLDVSTVTNIAARFWSAPVTGMVFSQMLDRGHRDRAMVSDYGKTDDPFGPHEFSYFWHHWFKIHEFPYDPKAVENDIDWAGFNGILGHMAAVDGKPLALKALDVVYHLPKVVETVKNSLIIYVERDLEEVARSLVQARIDYYGSVDEWWSMFPLNAHELQDRPWNEQVAGQVFELWKLHEAQIARVDQKRVLRFSYEDLCSSPQGFLDAVMTQMGSVLGYSVEQLEAPPKMLVPRETRLDAIYEEPLMQALHDCGKNFDDGDR